jgi:heptosyltransferase-1
LKVLLVKLSSLGDVVHVMPALQDMRLCMPGVQIDWAVEKSFAPLVRRCEGVGRVVECELRQWRKSPLSATTRRQWRAFKAELQAERYDAVIDLQGLTKSALVAWLARLAPKGKRYALANQTEGSSYEAPTRWVADVALQVEPHTHVVQRSREVCARALGYEMPAALAWGLNLHAFPTQPRVIALVHGTSRSDKLWPVAHWIELGGRLIQDGFRLALPHGNAQEQARSEHLAQALGGAATVWPRLSLDAMAEQLAQTSGVIGVDSGLSHIAVALDVPHVQIYNFDTAWRTGPLGSARQVAVYAQPEPDVGAVYDAWTKVLAA